MSRIVAVAKQDTLGLLAMGGIIVDLAQGEAHSRLSAWYDRLHEKYGLICREYRTLRRVNEDLQRQAREYERILDKLRVENGRLEKRLSEVMGA